MTDEVDYDKIFKNLESKLSKEKIKIYKGSDPTFRISRISSGIQQYDDILGGGFTRGGLHMLAGDSKSGKTTVALKLIASAQRQGFTTVYFDLERRIDQDWFEKCGVDLNKLYVPQYMLAEEVFKTIVILLDAGTDVIVVDSFASLAPKQIAEKEVDKDNVASLARLLDRAIENFFVPHNSKTVLLGINQFRVNINMTGFGKGIGNIMPGGKAQYYNAHTITEVKVKGGIENQIKEGKLHMGHFMQLSLKESLHSIPKRSCDVPLSYITGDVGMDIMTFAINSAVDYKVIVQSGPYYDMINIDPTLGKFKGMNKVIEYFKENEDKMVLLRDKVTEFQKSKLKQDSDDREAVNEIIEVDGDN